VFDSRSDPCNTGSDRAIAVETMGACPILAPVASKRTVNAQLQNCVPRLGFACSWQASRLQIYEPQPTRLRYSRVIASTRSVAADWFDV